MKKLFLIVYGVIMLITLIASVYLYTHQVTPPSAGNQPLEQTPLQPPAQETGPLYGYSSNGSRGPLIEPEKNALRVDESTGNAVLTEGSDYILEYFSQGRTFNIVLLNSNLREARVAAEQDLLKRFNLSQDQVCHLNVMVGTIVSVSQEFSGRQLGVSFCPGRVDLPTSVTDPSEAGSSAGTQPDAAL